jgi:hypothetical protein
LIRDRLSFPITCRIPFSSQSFSIEANPAFAGIPCYRLVTAIWFGSGAGWLYRITISSDFQPPSSMMMGIPVAATSVNGVPELVVHEETGMLSPPKNPEQLAANLAWLLDHPEAARQMGKNAQERALPLFGAEQMVAQIDELYERMLIMKEVGSPNLRLRLKSQAQKWKYPQGDSITIECESPSGDFHLCA